MRHDETVTADHGAPTAAENRIVGVGKVDLDRELGPDRFS
jgi:hypothetical protein